jgi:hypothetical protein
MGTTVVVLFASEHRHKMSTVSCKDRDFISMSASIIHYQKSTVVLVSTSLRNPALGSKTHPIAKRKCCCLF